MLTQIVQLKGIRAYDLTTAFLNEWVFKFGPPQIPVSENGSQFVPEFFQTVCKMLSVNNSTPTTYYRQANGQTDRFNNSQTAMLRCYVEDHRADWNSFARALCYVYNNAVYSSTGTTPFNLVSSRPLPELVIIQYDRRDPKRSIKEDLKKRLEDAIGKAKISLEAIKAKYKKDFDKRARRARKLLAGESVYLDTNNGFKKRDKLSHQVAWKIRILKVNKNNIPVTQRDAVVETVSSNRITRAPSSAKEIELGHRTSPSNLQKGNIEGETSAFKKILSHRERVDG